ncbi:MAG: NAD(+)/NADH kinase [Ignavibacteriales bacterium]|nr:NAD(+)/NADH kinase [Ignavibacteriales bacterium]
MIAGIIANTGKENIALATETVADVLKEERFECLISDTIFDLASPEMKAKFTFLNDDLLIQKSDIIISLGGDGTLLNTASMTLESGKPIAGVNFGKLGFLTEINKNTLNETFREIRNGEYFLEERIVLKGVSDDLNHCSVLGINDIVIEKGGWPKMMAINLFANGELVSEFSADGLIIATPTGSTGYSLSAGGPIVNPRADVIVISPICPHSLTMRPLVLPADMVIKVQINSHPVKFSINCDGQRVNELSSPFSIDISKGEKPLRLIRNKKSSYFNVLRSKLYWGIDAREGKS